MSIFDNDAIEILNKLAAHEDQITTADELQRVLEDARRYRALYRFVDDSDVGSIVADDVYADLSDADDAPPAPEHCSNTQDDGTTGISASYGLALDSLADFLDANRNAGKTRDLLDVERRLTTGENRSAKQRGDRDA